MYAASTRGTDAGAAPDDPAADEAAFAQRITAARTSRGLPPLDGAGDLTAVARNHAAQLARDRRIADAEQARAEQPAFAS